MTEQVVNVRTVERAGRLLDLLRSTDFNGFPVVAFKSAEELAAEAQLKAGGQEPGDDDGDDDESAGHQSEGGDMGFKVPRRSKKVHLGRYDVQGILRGLVLRKQVRRDVFVHCLSIVWLPLRLALLRF